MTSTEQGDGRGGRARWNAEQAREVLQEWERSGLSLPAFARERGFHPERLRRWRKRLLPPERGGAEPVEFLPVVVTGAAPGLRVSFASGWNVEVHDFGPESARWVAELVRGLESQAP